MAMKNAASNRPIPDEGVVPARLAYIIEVGEHEQGEFGVKDQVFLHYTLPTRIIPEGEYEGKQFMIRTAPLRNSVSEKAALWKHRIVLAPEGNETHEELLTKAAFLTITHNEVKRSGTTTKYANITNVSGVPEGMEVGDSDVTPFYFDYDNPDADIWTDRLWDQIREKIQESLNYEGSKVELMVKHLDAMSGDAE